MALTLQNIEEELKKIQAQFTSELAQAQTLEGVEQLRVSTLGKKAKFTELLRAFQDLPAQDKPAAGALVNTLKLSLQSQIEGQLQQVKVNGLAASLQKERIDVTLPGWSMAQGKKHPLTLVTEEVTGIFARLGFAVAEGPEVETDENNFTKLNTHPDHPARDLHDTLYLSDRVLLRSHTSPVQIRVMERVKPPLRFVFPGRCFRRDPVDASHSPFFHQIEGLLVDRHIQFSRLKGVLEAFLREFLGRDLKIKFLPSYFPFTEPSAEVLVEWKGGWLEILGCGMVHTRVLKNVGMDPEEWTGLAFGMGLDRLALLKYGIDDLRLMFDNNVNFLKQF